MENYSEFINRISAFETAEMSLSDGDFVPNPSLSSKVNESNCFSSFYGDTVVFDLDEDEKSVLTKCIHTIYKEADECFCEPLAPDTLHLTLHDLSNSPILQNVAESMTSNEHTLISVLSENQISQQTVRMRSKAVFNMVNTSLVAGFYPVDETEYIKLMKLYRLIDKVHSLPYPFTPHVTLAYYNINGFGSISVKKLEMAVNRLNEASFDIILDTGRLVYQKFTSMNCYENIFRLSQIK